MKLFCVGILSLSIVFFLGTLRPYPQTPKRTIPTHIARPDYADHPEGHPLGEQSARGSSYIKALSDEEKEGMRVVSKVINCCPL